MRSSRKRTITAIVFAATLVLGTTTLVLAWRLQQTKQITEEEAMASTSDGYFSNICGTSSPPPGSWSQHNANPQCQGCNESGYCSGNVVRVFRCGPGEEDSQIECRANGSMVGTRADFDSTFVSYNNIPADCWMYQIDVFGDETWNSLQDFVVWRGHRFGDPSCQPQQASCSSISGPEGEVQPGATLSYTGTINQGTPQELQWRLNGQNIANANSINYSTTAPTASGTYEYWLSVNNDNVAACKKTITVPPPESASCSSISGPEGEVQPGATLSYTGTINQGTPQELQWRLNGQNIANANSINYSTTAPTASGSYEYWLSVNNDNVAACKKTVTIPAPEPEAGCISKRISRINGTVVPVGSNPVINPGDTVEFTVRYQNSGDVDGNITLTDNVPNGFENVQVTSPSSGCTVTGNNISCTIATTSGQTGDVLITVRARDNVRDLNTTNTATVTMDGDTDMTNNTCSTSATPSDAGVVCVSKNASAGYSTTAPARPGDIITYTVNYTVERGPVTVNISEPVPQYLTILNSGQYRLPTGCSVSNDVLECVIVETNTGDYSNTLVFHAQIDQNIPLNGVTITNTITVKEDGSTSSEDESDCSETITARHNPPTCVVTTPSNTTIRVADIGTTTVNLTTVGNLGTHSDLEFRWTASGGTLSNTTWHESSGTPANGQVSDSVTWSPPAGATEDDTFEIKAYVRPVGSSDATGISAESCESVAVISALDLICNWMVPNNSYEFFPFDMTFSADIAGDTGATFTYSLDFGDGSPHYTGNNAVGTVLANNAVELPYIPPQNQPHTYNSTSPITYNPVLTVTNTETGETSVCPTILGGRTESEWSIVKDSDVDTCVAENGTVNYTIVVTNTGSYTADLAQVRDTIDAKINTSTITNIRECDSNGQNCITYNRADVLSGRTITWPGRTFAAGESRRYSYTVTLNSAGDYYNVAEAVPQTGETVRDDELFPTCAVPTAPQTGSLTMGIYITIFGMLIIAGGYYTYKTESGSLIVANALGKTKASLDKKLSKKKSFEDNAVKSSKRRLES